MSSGNFNCIVCLILALIFFAWVCIAWVSLSCIDHIVVIWSDCCDIVALGWVKIKKVAFGMDLKWRISQCKVLLSELIYQIRDLYRNLMSSTLICFQLVFEQLLCYSQTWDLNESVRRSSSSDDKGRLGWRRHVRTAGCNTREDLKDATQEKMATMKSKIFDGYDTNPLTL